MSYPDIPLPVCLAEFLLKITPEQADQLWLYFDGCTNEALIEICAMKALESPEIRERQMREDGVKKPSRFDP